MWREAGEPMNVDKELNLRLFLQREENITHSPYQNELSFYNAVKRGDLEYIKQIIQIRPLNKVQGKGVLSENPIRNLLFHMIISVAMVTRFCMEGGMDPELAYSLSDLYIQKADRCKNEKEIIEIHYAMCVDFTTRMGKIRRKKVYSKHIVTAIDYIFDHLHERITISELADITRLNENYLSKLFKKETGCSISDYIRNKKIEAAENMLKYSEQSFLQIANLLSFASQSHFTQVFKKHTGYTPKEYRDKYYRSNWEV